MKTPSRSPGGCRRTETSGWSWNAVRARVIGNQTIRKVKGHATQEHIDQGKSTPYDKDGNDQSDQLADESATTLNGKGLVRLARWLAARHKSYCKLVKRIHKVIVVVALAEQEERTKKKKLQQPLMDTMLESEPNPSSSREQSAHTRISPNPIAAADQW